MPAFAMMVIVVGVNTNKVRRGIRKIGAGVLACFFTAACTTGYASVRDSVGGFPNESIRSYAFSQGADSGTYLTPMQPIAIPWPEDSKVLLMRLRIE